MAPPPKVIREQLEILIEFLEENRELINGVPSTGTPPIPNHPYRQKWVAIAKKLNSVPGGTLKPPEGWKKYWFEYRYKTRKKTADSQRFQNASDAGKNRFAPLSDLELRVLELCGKGTGNYTPKVPMSQKLEDFLAEDSDSEPLKSYKTDKLAMKRQKTSSSSSRNWTNNSDNANRPSTPPPKWAIDLEERRIAAQEKMADALASMATAIKSQEERRSMLDERIADALTVIAGTVQDLNSGVHEMVQHLQQTQSLQNGPVVKEDDVFL